MSKQKRDQIIFLHERGQKKSSIAKELQVSVQMVQKAIKRFNETGSNQDRPRTGRPVTATTPRIRELIRQKVKRNSHRSMRALAKSMQISRGSVRIIVKDQLGLQSRKLFKAHQLTEAMKAKRLEKARKMLKLVANGRHRSVVFTDEKIFTIQQAHNHQNDRQLLPKGTCKLL